jgi:hypothetical protein
LAAQATPLLAQFDNPDAQGSKTVHGAKPREPMNSERNFRLARNPFL